VEIMKSDHMVVRSFEVFRENVCSIHTGDIIFASCGSRFGAIDSLRLLCQCELLACNRHYDKSFIFNL
jgi:hypothetical protein